MPAGRPENAAGASNNPGPQRTNFRPPWVKESPQPIPMPTAPWTLANRNKEITQQAQAQARVEPEPKARKTSTVKIVPIQPQENGSNPHTFAIPKLKEIPKTESKLQSREVKVPITLTSRQKEPPIQSHIDRRSSNFEIPVLKEVKKEVKEAPVVKETRRESKEAPVVKEVRKPDDKIVPIVKDIQESRKEPDIDKAIPAKRNEMVRQESLKKMGGPVGPAPPPMPPMPPPPPAPPMNKDTSKLNAQQLEKIEQLRSRPRRRPDWGAMMKEVESGKKLRKVQCNDRSQPLLPKNNVKGQFIYDSEKPNLHNQLLRQIQTGKPLKHVKCNDRSKPILEGLRKFRRQMTIEEQIQKSQSIANMAEPEVEEEVDEMDDIDKIRDDLQSTKQMLALELRNKEAQIRENKRLQARLLNLEAELEKERALAKSQGNNVVNSTPDDKDVQKLKEEIIQSKKNAEAMEQKYHETTDQLETVKFELEEAKRQNQYLEKRMQIVQQEGGPKKSMSIADRRESAPAAKEKEETESEPESESESESDDDDAETKALKRTEREVRFLGNKLRSYKNKEEAARRERKSLRDQMKKNQHAIKQEKKKYRELQREVNKMAALMRDEEECEDEEEEEKEENEDEAETEEESESESESETSEEEDSSESEAEEVPLEKKKENLQNRAKRHENCLNALKKGNYMLKANVDRLQDDLNKQKEEVITLQEDLDSVLADLG